jgi:hypothetical protein
VEHFCDEVFSDESSASCVAHTDASECSLERRSKTNDLDFLSLRSNTTLDLEGNEH